MLRSELPKSFGSSQHVSVPKRSKNDEFLIPVVDSLFKKHYPIKNNNFITPKPETMFTEDPWHVEELQQLKIELNEIKNRLNDYKIAEWHEHTRRRNRAGDVQWRLRKEIEPEFLTQAWCKFYEIVSTFPLIPETAIESNRLISVHLCEAPGAFVTSLNHWLKLNVPYVEWDWLATTLNPYYEGNPLSCMINDDRFIISSLEHWCFGTDYTGNLMNLKNMDDLVAKAKEKGDILLVTADGSIDCINNPGEQESIVSPLHFCEAVTAMELLSKHGSLLLKMFTIFEHDSLSLVYLLSCMFDQVFVSKPATSKEGNSEIYLVCLDYHGPNCVAPYLKVLRKYYEAKSDKSMFRKRDIPVDFIRQMISCGEFFKAFQSDVILKNIEAYSYREDNGRVDFERKKIKRMVASKYIVACGLKKLETEGLEVVGKAKLALVRSIILDARIQGGSYNERRTMKNLDPKSLLLALCDDINMIKICPTTQWFTFAGSLEDLQINYGKKFLKVQSSKFCMGKFLKIRNGVFDLLDKLGLDHPCDPVQSVKDFFDVVGSEAKNHKYLSFEQSVIEKNNKTLSKINEQLDCLLKGESLVLIGYSLLTQVNVGVLYILAHTFRSLGLMFNEQFSCIIILEHNLLVKSIFECFKRVYEATIEAEAAGESVLSVIPITKLCESDLYSGVVDANHWSIKHFVNNVRNLAQEK